MAQDPVVEKVANDREGHLDTCPFPPGQREDGRGGRGLMTLSAFALSARPFGVPLVADSHHRGDLAYVVCPQELPHLP